MPRDRQEDRRALVIELKSRVGAADGAVPALLAGGKAPAGASPHADAVAALVALGYKVGDADEERCAALRSTWARRRRPRR